MAIGYVTIDYGASGGYTAGGSFYLDVYSSLPGYLADEAATKVWPAMDFKANVLTRFGPFPFDMWTNSTKSLLIFGAYLPGDGAYTIRLIPQFVL